MISGMCKAIKKGKKEKNSVKKACLYLSGQTRLKSTQGTLEALEWAICFKNKSITMLKSVRERKFPNMYHYHYHISVYRKVLITVVVTHLKQKKNPKKPMILPKQYC